MKRISIAAAVVVGSAALSSSAFAFTATNPATDTFHVGLTVMDECTISTTDITFADVGIVAGILNAPGAVTIQCTHTTPYQVGLSGGASGDTSDRTMSAGATDVVHYQLYSDSGYGSVWGNDPGVDTVDSGVGGATGADEVLPVYAHIVPHQNVAPGVYDDTITATIWYAGTVTGP